jgi:hypothetical protein
MNRNPELMKSLERFACRPPYSLAPAAVARITDRFADGLRQGETLPPELASQAEQWSMASGFVAQVAAEFKLSPEQVAAAVQTKQKPDAFRNYFVVKLARAISDSLRAEYQAAAQEAARNPRDTRNTSHYKYEEVTRTAFDPNTKGGGAGQAGDLPAGAAKRIFGT